MIFDLESVRERRNALKIPLSKMALELGFKDASTYLRYEKGDYLIKAEQLPMLAKILKCDVSDFFNC